MSSVPSRGELYDWEQRNVLGRSDQDVAFFTALTLAPGGPVLEVACGTGRVTEPLAATGTEVVGLDVDREMLAVARRRCPTVPLVVADMRRFALHRRFPLVIVPYNGLQLLVTPDDRAACMSVLAEHLAPGGRLAFEVRDFISGAATTELAHEPLATAALGEATVTLHAGLDQHVASRVTTYRRRFEVHRPDTATQLVDHDIALYSYRRGEVEVLLDEVGLVGHGEPAGAATRWIARAAR